MSKKETRTCSWCGKTMTEGYVIDGDYACSDKCRNNIYKRDCGAQDDEEAEILYLMDYYYLTDDDVKGLDAEEIVRKFDSDKTSDVVYYTWFN